MDASAMEAEWSTNFVDPQRVALAQQMMRDNGAYKPAMFTKLQEEEGEAEEGAAEEGGAVPLKEPGFVIATTDDSTPP